MHISLWLETPVIEVPPPPHPTVLLFVKCDIIIGLWLLIMPSGLTGFQLRLRLKWIRFYGHQMPSNYKHFLNLHHFNHRSCAKSVYA